MVFFYFFFRTLSGFVHTVFLSKGVTLCCCLKPIGLFIKYYILFSKTIAFFSLDLKILFVQMVFFYFFFRTLSGFVCTVFLSKDVPRVAIALVETPPFIAA
jgi:hypothetical protein